MGEVGASDARHKDKSLSLVPETERTDKLRLERPYASISRIPKKPLISGAGRFLPGDGIESNALIRMHRSLTGRTSLSSVRNRIYFLELKELLSFIERNGRTLFFYRSRNDTQSFEQGTRLNPSRKRAVWSERSKDSPGWNRFGIRGTRRRVRCIGSSFRCW